MKKISIKVVGMTCKHCESTIKENLLKLKQINNVKVSLKTGIVDIYSNKEIKEKTIEKVINDSGYKYIGLVENYNKRAKIKELIPIILIILTLYLILGLIFGFNFINYLPNINSSITIPALFIIRLLTSIHCIGMCGSINLMASVNNDKKSIKNPLLYNLGRIISYTIVGAIVGLIGSIFNFNSILQGIIILIAGILMIMMGLSMIGYLPKTLFKFLPFLNININRKNKTPFVIGLLNGLMPCGPLQAMQLYALSTGSIYLGALSMFVFSLGTIPLVLGFGILFSTLNKKYNVIIQRISAVLIILLSIFMLNRSFNLMGINLQKPVDYTGYNVAEVYSDYQYVEITLKPLGYTPIVVEKGKPVRFNIKVINIERFGCTSAVKIPEYNIYKPLQNGDNIIEFTPTETGDFIYTCWMGIVSSRIKVVDKINNIDK